MDLLDALPKGFRVSVALQSIDGHELASAAIHPPDADDAAIVASGASGTEAVQRLHERYRDGNHDTN